MIIPFLRMPQLRDRIAHKSSGFVLDYRQDIPCGIGEPGDGRAVPPHNTFGVRLDVPVIMLELNALYGKTVDRGVDILHFEIQDCKGSRLMIGFRIDKDLVVRRLYRKPLFCPGDRQPQDLTVKIVCLVQIIHGETGKCVLKCQHIAKSLKASSANFGPSLYLTFANCSICYL
jgi:hypothetical protein